MKYQKLSEVLKYAKPGDRTLSDLRQRRKLLHPNLQRIIQSPHKNFGSMLSPDDVANAGIKKWHTNQFVPTPTTPEPAHADTTPGEYQAWADELSKHGPINNNHINHFHNLAAVVAGRVPAAIVDHAFLMNHPVGRALLGKALTTGNSHFKIKTGSGNLSVVGRPDNLIYIKNGLLNGQEHEVKRGLGWPESRIPKPVQEEESRVPF